MMQDTEKDIVKKELANITTPLNLPQIRQRAKSIENQIQKLKLLKDKSKEKSKDQSKEKQRVKLPLIENKSVRKNQQNQTKEQNNKKEDIKPDFLTDVQAKLKNVLKGMGEVVPEDGYGSYDSEDFDFEFKIKKNQEQIKIKRIQSLSAKQKSMGEIDHIMRTSDDRNIKILNLNNCKQKKQRPKSSQDSSNDNQLINFRNKSLIKKRPRSSKRQQFPRSQQIGLQTKIQYKFEDGPQNKRATENNCVRLQNNATQQRESKTECQKRQNIPKSPNQNKIKKPKIPKPLPRSPVLEKQIIKEQDKPRNNINIKVGDKNSRSNQKSANKSKPKGMTPKSIQNVNRIKLSPIKSQKRMVIVEAGSKQVMENYSSHLPSLKENAQNNHHSRTQQLKQMKIELDKKIQKIQKQMEAINPERGKKVEVIQNWMQLSAMQTRQLGKEVQLDKELQKLEKLQNRGERIMGDYLQHRMMLMNINTLNGQSEILQQAYLGDEKNTPTNNI